MVKSRLVLFCLVLYSVQAFSQKDRYMVFFSDKDDSPYSITAPEAFLSERSIQRRSDQEIPIIEEDLPVNQVYINAVANTGAETYFSSRWLNGVIIQVEENLLAEISDLPFVDSIAYVAPGTKLLPFNDNAPQLTASSDPDASSLSSDTQLGMLRANLMHDDGYTGEGKMIAVIDGGFLGVNISSAYQHILDNDRLVATKDFINNSTNVYNSSAHGAQVFSCIAAKYGDQMVGTAYDASFVLCKTEDVSQEYIIEEYNWVFAAEFADSIGVDVINTSAGYTDFDDSSMDHTYEDLDGETTIISRAQDIAFRKGMLIVTSVGNLGDRNWRFMSAPADAINVIAVGGVTGSGSKVGSSSFGPTADGRLKPEVAAMGSGTVIVNNVGNLATNQGTSFASPLIAGFAASLWQARPELTNLELRHLILQSASQASDPDNSLGYGIPNYLEALDRDIVNVKDILADKVKVYPNPVDGNRLNLQFSNVAVNSGMKIAVVDLNGKVLLRKKITNEQNNEVSIDISSLQSSTYLLRLTYQKNSHTIRFVKI